MPRRNRNAGTPRLDVDQLAADLDQLAADLYPVLPTGRGPLGVAVDPSTGTVYVADFFSAAVTILNGSRQSGRQQAVGSSPQSLAVNPGTHTVYVTQVFQAGSMSIIKTTRQ